MIWNVTSIVISGIIIEMKNRLRLLVDLIKRHYNLNTIHKQKFEKKHMHCAQLWILYRNWDNVQHNAQLFFWEFPHYYFSTCGTLVENRTFVRELSEHQSQSHYEPGLMGLMWALVSVRTARTPHDFSLGSYETFSSGWRQQPGLKGLWQAPPVRASFLDSPHTHLGSPF
jgi:hypothetical protein